MELKNSKNSKEEFSYKNSTQQFSSKNSSINKNKLPAIFRLIEWKPNTKNLDYGGGKFDIATNTLKKCKVENFIYDPYNRDKIHNDTVMKISNYDTATLSNVLNVIKESTERKKCVINCLSHLKNNGTLYITIYEGNKSGVGKVSKMNNWQENRILQSYVKELKEFKPIRKGKIIIIKK